MKTFLSLKALTQYTIILTIFLLVQASTSFAITFTVTNLNDSGAGSLRQAILDANANNNGPGIVDEIVFDVGIPGTIFLSAGEMTINDDLVIMGPGANALTIDAQMMSRVFKVDDIPSPAKVSISGLKFVNGSASNFESIGPTGGAIFNRGELTIDMCVFENNTSGSGGAIYNSSSSFNAGLLEIANSSFNGNNAGDGGAIDNFLGTITKISNSTFDGNSADDGGAIISSGTIKEITNTTFNGNSATVQGGAIWNAFPGTIESIKNSTFSNNNATGRGGAIFNQLDRRIDEITNCTFSGNSSGVDGGAIWNQGTINISFTTIANNHADDEGGGIFENGGSIRIRNSIVSFNSASIAGPNCNQDISTLISEINNSSNDSSCGFDGDNSNIMLGPLSNNGGPTQTLPLLGGHPLDGASAACDPFNRLGIPTGFSVNIDQRNFSRPFGAFCDIGSYEAQISAPPSMPPDLPDTPPDSPDEVEMSILNMINDLMEVLADILPEPIVTTPNLLTPINNAIVQQNNPDIGCPFNPTFGFGLSIFFDWTDASSPNGINGYHLFVKQVDAIFPTIDMFVLESNFTHISCNTFVIDANLNDWIWTVQAEDNLGNLSSIATGQFMYEPCRLDNGAACNAPP